MIEATAEPVVSTSPSVPLDAAAAPTVQSGAPPRAEPLFTRLANWLGTRGVRSTALVAFSVSFAATAAFLFLVGHPGMGGVLGLVALLGSELAIVPQSRETHETTDLARGVNPMIDLLLVIGVFGGIAVRESAPLVALAFLALVTLVWLPLLRTAAGPTRLPATAGLWRRGERLGILLFAVLLGRPAPGLFMLLMICGFDAYLRVERLTNPLGFQPQFGPRFMQKTIRADGSLDPIARWVTIAVTLLAILVMPQSVFWRF